MYTFNTRLEFRHYDSYTGGGCNVFVNGVKDTSLRAGGCGYDRQGSAFAHWIMKQPEIWDKIKHLTGNRGSMDTPTGYYGLSHYNTKTKKHQKRMSKYTKESINGACGFNCMRALVEAVGYSVQYGGGNDLSNFYIISKKGR